MRVLHIGKYFSPFKGGVEYVTQSIAEYTAKVGHAVRVLVHKHDRKREDDLEEAGNGSVVRVPIWGTLLFTPIAPFYAYYLWRELTRRPDVIHIHMPNPSAFWLLLFPSARRAKWLVHWHSDVIDEQASLALKLFYRAYRPFEYWLLGKSDAIICTSPGYANNSSALRAFRHKIHVVPLGIEVGRAPRMETPSEDQPLDSITLLTVGRLTYYKGHRYLLEAISQLKKQGINVIWNIVGTGEELNRLQKQSASLNLTENVRFLRRLDDRQLEEQFKRCDVFCLPSIERTEAFGIVLLEAMRASKPCIVTDVPGSGMNFVVEHEETGLVVKRANAEALATAVMNLVNEPRQLQAYGRAGRKRLEKVFDADVVNEQMLEIYRRLR